MSGFRITRPGTQADTDGPLPDRCDFWIGEPTPGRHCCLLLRPLFGYRQEIEDVEVHGFMLTLETDTATGKNRYYFSPGSQGLASDGQSLNLAATLSRKRMAKKVFEAWDSSEIDGDFVMTFTPPDLDAQVEAKKLHLARSEGFATMQSVFEIAKRLVEDKLKAQESANQ